MSIRSNKTHPLHTFIENPDKNASLPDIENSFQYTELLKDYYPCKIKYPKKFLNLFF